MVVNERCETAVCWKNRLTPIKTGLQISVFSPKRKTQ